MEPAELVRGGRRADPRRVLWLNLEDDYWTKQGRESVDAVVLFGAVLMLTAVGRKPLFELLAMTRRGPRTRALLRGRRAALHHPRRR